MQYSYAIFDMDGTLVDSMGYWDETCSEFLAGLTIPDGDLFDKLKPMTLGQTVEYLNETFHLNITEDIMKSKIFKLMMEHYKHDVKMKPGVTAFLNVLRENGVRMCVASSSPINMVETCLCRLGLDGYFEFLISAEEFGKGKTEPDIYCAAAKKLGAAPAQTMVFEDALGAALTAKKAGFPVTAIYDVNGEAEWETFRDMADDVITDWNEAAGSLS